MPTNFLNEDDRLEEYSESDKRMENLQRLYDIAKSLKCGLDLRTALDTFQNIIDVEEIKGEWGFRAHKQMAKIWLSSLNVEKSLRHVSRLLLYLKYISESYAAKTFDSILGCALLSLQQEKRMQFYILVVNYLREHKYDQLLFKESIRLAHFYLNYQYWAEFDEILIYLRTHVEIDPGKEDLTRGMLLLHLYNIAIQKYFFLNNDEKCKQIYDYAHNIECGRLYPPGMTPIEEYGGMMFLRNFSYLDAYNAFLAAFKCYHIYCSSTLRVFKLMVVASMLQRSASQFLGGFPYEVKSFLDEEYENVKVMFKLFSCYMRHDFLEFDRILATDEELKCDRFIKEHLTLVPTNYRKDVLRQNVMEQQASISLTLAAVMVDVSVPKVICLLSSILPDYPEYYGIDRQASMLYHRTDPRVAWKLTNQNQNAGWNPEVVEEENEVPEEN